MMPEEARNQAIGASKKYTDKIAVAFASGFDHAEATNNPDGSVTLKIFFKNGTTVEGTIDGVEGRSVDNVVVRQETDGNHLICIMSDGVEIDSGVIDTTAEGYTQEITAPSNTWFIQHNLNAEWWKLQINIIDENRNIIYGEVDETQTTNNLLVVKFESPIKGKAYIKK